MDTLRVLENEGVRPSFATQRWINAAEGATEAQQKELRSIMFIMKVKDGAPTTEVTEMGVRLSQLCGSDQSEAAEQGMLGAAIEEQVMNTIAESHLSEDELDRIANEACEACINRHLEEGKWSDLTEEETARMCGILREHFRVFGKIDHKPAVNVELFSVSTKEGTKPVFQNLRRMSKRVEEGVLQQLNELVKMGIFERCSSSWAANIVAAAKKDGGVRVAFDYRDVNTRTEMVDYPSARGDAIFRRLTDNNDVFSTVDLKSGFMQIGMDPEVRPMYAVITPWGQYQPTRMMFGPKQAPQFFHMAMNKVLGPMYHLGLDSFVDDILAFTKGRRAHLHALERLFDRLEEFNSKVNPAKCNFCQRELEFLGC